MNGIQFYINEVKFQTSRQQIRKKQELYWPNVTDRIFYKLYVYIFIISIKSYTGYGDFDSMEINSCLFTSIEKKKLNKAAEEGNFVLPNTSANISIFYYLITEHSWIYIYIG